MRDRIGPIVFVFLSITCLSFTSSQDTLTPEQQKILDDVSWAAKIKLLKEMFGGEFLKTTPEVRRANTKRPDMRRNYPKIIYLEKGPKRQHRRVGLDYLVQRREKFETKEDLYGDIESRKPIKVVDSLKSDVIHVPSPDVSGHNEKARYESVDVDKEFIEKLIKYKKNNGININEYLPQRRQAQVPLSSPEPNIPQDPESIDEKNMKMKLFRMMYENVKDSDIKVKRAELIQSAYKNSTALEIGYLMGGITDKSNMMSDVAATLIRLYNDWKPIEHVNAYEQIVQQSIEIGHLIDMVHSVHKGVQPVKP